MKSPSLSLIALFITCCCANLNAQHTIPTPAIWLKVNTEQGVSNAWLNVAGQQVFSLNRGDESPALEGAINFNPALKFDGINDHIPILYSVDAPTQFTFFSVIHPQNTNKESGVWGTINSGRNIMLTTHRVVGPKSILDYQGGNANMPLLNSLVQYWDKSDIRPTDAAFYLGNTGKDMENVIPFGGLIAEYIVFDRALSINERTIMQSYLALKYGITINYHNYKDSSNEVIWNNDENKEYANHIAGIGRDDAFGLHQKQSSSTAERSFLTIAANEIAENNSENTTTLNNQDFLTWGDNGASYTNTNVIRSEYPNLSMINRKWMMDVSGMTAHEIPTELQLNISKMSESKDLPPYLVIDRSGEGDFYFGELEYIPMSSLTENGLASFKDIKWDTDNSGQDAFTFAVNPDLLISTFIREFTVFPNPSNGNFSIDIVLEGEADATITITDAKGAVLDKIEGKKASNYRFNQTINDVAGVYFITLETEGKTETKKLVIK